MGVEMGPFDDMGEFRLFPEKLGIFHLGNREDMGEQIFNEMGNLVQFGEIGRKRTNLTNNN
jgi:hypothetical protein